MTADDRHHREQRRRRPPRDRTRSDFAEATAIVLTTPGHEGKAYELSGDTAWNYSEFADTAQQILGIPVSYQAPTPNRNATCSPAPAWTTEPSDSSAR